MRLILIIITLLGAVISAYSLSADAYSEIGVANLVEVVYPTAVDLFLSPKASEFTHKYDAWIFEQRKDSFIVSGIGGCVFILGFVGLIVDRRRQHKKMQPNPALEPTATAP
jgi:hypothetical protein